MRTNPPKYDNAKTLSEKIDEYFEQGENERTVIVKQGNQHIEKQRKSPYTLEGLSLYLGFASPQSLWDYLNRNEHKDDQTKQEIAYVLTCAKTRIGRDIISGCILGEYDSKTGATVLSKHGYVKEIKQDITIKGSVSLEERLLRAEKELTGGND